PLPRSFPAVPTRRSSDLVPSYTDEESSELAATASDPVQMSFEREHDLGRFGEGLAPLFLAISLWVGGMAIFLMMPPFSAEAMARDRKSTRLNSSHVSNSY